MSIDVSHNSDELHGLDDGTFGLSGEQWDASLAEYIRLVCDIYQQIHHLTELDHESTI